MATSLTGSDSVMLSPMMTDDDCDQADIEHAAAFLYRDERDWAPDAIWGNLSENAREPYLRRARTLASMFGFPYAARTLRQLDRLCPCDPNPETTEGPLRECPLHGEQPDAVTAVAAAVHIVDTAPGGAALDSAVDALLQQADITSDSDLPAVAEWLRRLRSRR